jgi:hypothetical protein
MGKISTLAILFSSLFISVSAQSTRNRIQGWTLDKSTLQPLPYSVIADMERHFGYYSDSTGLFTLFYNTETDSIKISNLGYKSVRTNVRELIKDSKILLERININTSQLDGTSRMKRAYPIDIGHFSLGSKPVMGTIYPLNIHAIYIPYPNGIQKNAFIKSVNINYTSGKLNRPLRIRILSIDPNGSPGEDLIYENIIFTVPLKKQKNEAVVDISKFNIQMPRLGLFLAIEYIMNTTPVELRKESDILGPYLGLVKKPEFTPNPWITGYNSAKWNVSVSDNIPAVGLTVVDISE